MILRQRLVFTDDLGTVQKRLRGQISPVRTVDRSLQQGGPINETDIRVLVDGRGPSPQEYRHVKYFDVVYAVQGEWQPWTDHLGRLRYWEVICRFAR